MKQVMRTIQWSFETFLTCLRDILLATIRKQKFFAQAVLRLDVDRIKQTVAQRPHTIVLKQNLDKGRPIESKT